MLKKKPFVRGFGGESWLPTFFCKFLCKFFRRPNMSKFPGVRSHVVIEFASSSIKWRKLLASGIELGSPHVHFSYVYRTVAIYFLFSLCSIPFDSVWRQVSDGEGQKVKSRKIKKRKEQKSQDKSGLSVTGSHMCGYQWSIKLFLAFYNGISSAEKPLLFI